LIAESANPNQHSTLCTHHSHCSGQLPVTGCTLTTRNSGIAIAPDNGLPVVGPAAVAPGVEERAGAGTTVPTIWTRRPIHDVMSVPLNR
jgi:hypothetical protein